MSAPQAATLELLRAAGNRATGRRLQRYAQTQAYTTTGAGTLFDTSVVEHAGPFRAPVYKRHQTMTDAMGNLTSQKLSFDPNAGAVAPVAAPVAVAVGGGGIGAPMPAAPIAPGAWAPDPGPAAAVAQRPPLKLSAGGRIAVLDRGEPRNFFIEANHLAAQNVALAAANSGVRLLATGGPSIVVGGLTLVQATVAKSATPTVAATDLKNECNEVASIVTGQVIAGDRVAPAVIAGLNPGTSGVNAAPAVGQSYAFQSDYDANPVFDQPLATKKDKEIRAFAEDRMREWTLAAARLELQLNPQYNTMDAKVKTLLNGWKTHFEGVVAVDGADTLTLVNYNRIVGAAGNQAMNEKKALFRELYLRSTWFRQDFLARLIAQAKARKKAKQQFTWFDAYLTIDQTIDGARGTAHDAAVAQAIADYDRFKASAGKVANYMWYFSMYEVGHATRSFHGAFGWAGRGEAMSTRVI